MRVTACDCDAAGWCPRHGCTKSEMLFQFCQRSQDLFDAWEQGRGPCFNSTPPPDDVTSTPGLAQRALNFGTAVVRHALNGFERVDQSTCEARLQVCALCPSCEPIQFVCRERSCGCFIRQKAWWASEDCPLSKWPKVTASVVEQE